MIYNINKYRNLVYFLQDPISMEIRYIGLSTIGVKRMRQHSQPAFLQKDKTYKANWIRTLISKGLKPLSKVIQTFDHSSREELQEAEKYWISYYKSIGCPLTNLTSGGDGAIGYKWKENDPRRSRPHPMQGKKLSLEERKRVSELTKEAMKDPAIRKKCGSIGNIPWNKGLKMSKEFCNKISSAQKGKEKPCKQVSIIDQNGVIYNSIKSASKILNITYSNIQQVLAGKNKTARGYNFKYLNQENKEYKYKKVISVKDNLGNSYRSLKEASKKTGLDARTIFKYLNNKKTIKGFSFLEII